MNLAHTFPDPSPSLATPGVLDQLIRRRYHGAGNIRGIRYQLLYFALRTFDLYRSEDAPESVVGEGLEDVDLRSVRSGNEYVQLKHFSRPLDWSKLSGVISSFGEVMVADPSARLTLVTNVGLAAEAAALQRHIDNGSNGTPLPSKVRTRLEDALRSTALIDPAGPVPVERFLTRFRIARRPEAEVLRRLYGAVIQHFGVTSGNEELYAVALFGDLASRAGNRAEVRRLDMEVLRARIESLIALGPVNPAVRDGFVSAMSFARSSDGNGADGTPQAGSRVADYYEGRAARPDHILAGLDVARPAIIARIDDVLARASVCAIVASSGQGKSTLALRYARDGFPSGAVFSVRACQNEEDVGHIARFLRSQLGLGLPLLVVIDNLGYRTRLWHRLAAEMAAEPVTFVVTAREEDWFRYRGSIADFTWDVVRPELGFDEARQIYSELKKRGRVMPEVTSAEWAYERVRERRLLIEFVYLLTQGRLLADRLEEQVASIREADHDPGKLEALRLVSVAQRYGARVRTSDLIEQVRFRGDAQQGLASLLGEYVLCTEGECEGLHPVRSEHLIDLLHGPLPVANTVKHLLGFLDEANLVALARSALADARIEAAPLLEALTERCSLEQVRLIGPVAEACFEAEERRYFERHRPLFNEANRLGGDALVMMLALSVLPRGDYRAVESLRGMSLPGANPAVDWLENAASKVEPRGLHDRLDFWFLHEFLAKVDPAVLARDLPVLADVLFWCHDAAVTAEEQPAIAQALENSRWRAGLYALSIEAAATLALALTRVISESYRAWSVSEKDKLISFFKKGTRTFEVSERTDDEEGSVITIRFPVDMAETEGVSPNDQAVNRLYILQRLVPTYDLYESHGLYFAGEDAVMPYDPAHKRLAIGDSWQEVDTRKNGAWRRLCQYEYAADSFTSWLDTWGKLRANAHTLVRGMHEVYVSILRGAGGEKIARSVNSLGINDLQEKIQHAPILPVGTREAERNRIDKRLGRWTTGLTNFLRQFSQHDPNDGNQSDSRLMRINLRTAMQALSHMAEALEEVRRLAGSTVDHPGATEEEADYRRLVDVFDYWFGPWRHHRLVGGSLTNPQKTITEWRYGEARSALATADRAVDPMRDRGLLVVLPTALHEDDHSLSGLVVGLEVRDFHHVEREVSVLLALLGEGAPEVEYVYIVPLLPGLRLFRKEVFRAGRDNARQFATGKPPEGMWIFPMEPPPLLLSLLPGLLVDPLREGAMLGAVLDASAATAVEGRLREAARRHLNQDAPFEAELLRDIEAEFARKRARATKHLEAALDEMRSFPAPGGEVGAHAWEELVTTCEVVSRRVADGQANIQELTHPTSRVVQAWNSYLNAAYLGIPLD